MVNRQRYSRPYLKIPTLVAIVISMTTDVVNPLHPEIIPRLDPEYASYYNAHLANQLQAHQVPWDPAIRLKAPVVGGAPPLDVGFIEDVAISKCKLRIFWPKDPSDAPSEGWPIFLFFHGG